jgi:hypothetical protein
LVSANGSALTALQPLSSFRPAGVGPDAIADRYWFPQTVDVPVEPGVTATFVVRAFPTSAGSYEAAQFLGLYGQSAPFTLAVGGGLLPPANLTTLQAFVVGICPEPSPLALGALGAVALFYKWSRPSLPQRAGSI